MMHESDWDRVVDVMMGLWPKSRELTPENLKVWRDTCDRFPVEWVVGAFQRAKQRGKFFPEHRAIREILADKMARHADEPSAAESLRDQRDRERAELDREWQLVAEALADFSDAELAQHKRTILAANPRLGWCAGANPRTSKSLARFLLDRIHNGQWPESRQAFSYRLNAAGDLEIIPVTVTDAELAAADQVIARAKSSGDGVAAMAATIGKAVAV